MHSTALSMMRSTKNNAVNGAVNKNNAVNGSVNKNNAVNDAVNKIVSSVPR